MVVERGVQVKAVRPGEQQQIFSSGFPIRTHEGNTKEENNGYVVFEWNICGLAELEFLKSLWGLGTKEEEGYRTGPPGYIG